MIDTYLAQSNLLGASECTGYAPGLSISKNARTKLKDKANRAGKDEKAGDVFAHIVGFLACYESGSYIKNSAVFRTDKKYKKKEPEKLVDEDIRGTDYHLNEAKEYLYRSMRFGTPLHTGRMCIQVEVKKK